MVALGLAAAGVGAAAAFAVSWVREPSKVATQSLRRRQPHRAQRPRPGSSRGQRHGQRAFVLEARASRWTGGPSGDRLEADPVRRDAARGDGRLREAPLRARHLAAARPEGDRRALHGERLVLVRRGTPSRPTRPTWSCTSSPGRALTSCRHRRDDLPARPADDDVPPHRRPQLDGDRDRARRDERPADPRQPAPARGVARADALADGRYRIQLRERDRPQREPDEPVPPRALRAWRCQTHGDWSDADMRTCTARTSASSRSATGSRSDRPPCRPGAAASPRPRGGAR